MSPPRKGLEYVPSGTEGVGLRARGPPHPKQASKQARERDREKERERESQALDFQAAAPSRGKPLEILLTPGEYSYTFLKLPTPHL